MRQIIRKKEGYRIASVKIDKKEIDLEKVSKQIYFEIRTGGTYDFYRL